MYLKYTQQLHTAPSQLMIHYPHVGRFEWIFMIKKINRLAVVFVLTESIAYCSGSTIESFDMEEQNAKIAVAGLMDSLEARKPTRSFKLSLMAIQKNQRKLKSFSKNKAEQDFFTAISDVLTASPIKDDSINTILKVAQDGYKQARAVVKIALGKKINFKTNDWMSIAKENLKTQIRQLVENSSSGDETSVDDLSSDEEIGAKPHLTLGQGNESDEEETYTIEQLQDYVSLGITEYLRDNANNMTARSLIEDSVEQLLRFSEGQYTKKQLLEDIKPLNFSSTQQFYEELKQKVLGQK